MSDLPGGVAQSVQSWLEISTMVQVATRNSEFLASAYNVSQRGFITLLHLYENPAGINLSTLASLTGVKRPTMTGIIGSLQKRDLIAIQEDEYDRRILHAHLTDDARSLIIELLPRKLRMITDMFKKSSEKELLDAQYYLSRLIPVSLSADDDLFSIDPNHIEITLAPPDEFAAESFLSLSTWIHYSSFFMHTISQLEGLLNQNDFLYSQWITLTYLTAEDDSLNNNELASLVLVSVPTMTTIINRLVRDGYVWRQRSLNNRRTVDIRTTKPGREIASQLGEKILERLNQWFGKWSEVEHRHMQKITQSALDQLRDPLY